MNFQNRLFQASSLRKRHILISVSQKITLLKYIVKKSISMTLFVLFNETQISCNNITNQSVHVCVWAMQGKLTLRPLVNIPLLLTTSLLLITFFFVLFICIHADVLLVQANHYSDGYTSTDGQF